MALFSAMIAGQQQAPVATQTLLSRSGQPSFSKKTLASIQKLENSLRPNVKASSSEGQSIQTQSLYTSPPVVAPPEPETKKPMKKIRVLGKFKGQLKQSMGLVDAEFVDSSIEAFSDYLEQLTLQEMFNSNLQYPEFVYIFQDDREIAAPRKAVQIAESLEKVKEIKKRVIADFSADLAWSQAVKLNETIENYTMWLDKNQNEKVGYYPRTKAMKQALLDAVNIRYELVSNNNFDNLLRTYSKEYEAAIRGLLTLDEDTRKEMDGLRKEGEEHDWMHHQGEPGVKPHVPDSGLDLDEVYNNMKEFEHNHRDGVSIDD